MLEVEAVPQSCIPIGLSIALYKRSLLFVESFDHYILVKVIPSCFRFAEMCLR
jgi:hypothetical protein